MKLINHRAILLPAILLFPVPGAAQENIFTGVNAAAAALVSVPAAPEPSEEQLSPGPDREPARPDFSFDPAEIAAHRAVLVTINGMSAKSFLPGPFRDKELEPFLEDSGGLFGGGVSLHDIDDPYVEEAFKAALAPKDYLVLAFPWTRNPLRSSAALNDFRYWLGQVYEAARQAGKPVDLVAHSWGCLLSYTLLKGLQDEGSPVKIDNYMTLGAPFHPKPLWLSRLVSLAVRSQGLTSSTAPLNNVKKWINVYADRDIISNMETSGPGANIRVDERIDPIEAELRRQFGGPAGDQARKDLDALNNDSAWHHAPLFGIHLYLGSIDKRVDLDIMRDYIAPLF